MIRKTFVFAAAAAGLALITSAQTATPRVKATPLMTRDLHGIAGKEATVLTVELDPGAASPAHRHEASTFVYVLEGSIVMGVKGGKEVTLGPGEVFYENPDDIHTVSRNASATRSAKFLVFMVKAKGAPISIPVSDRH